ncbi:type II CAAX endopeptidase family protein [Mesorhizobium sp. DCY119]|uniref:CPBP family intramembrane glutamic endopeptidase n=1 Tax=Mesorhizobium sp. DCY119 TaxID=2108445 RepID=UPI000E6BCCA8|nr:type II CAAX endopeptidase family protein [Mesorhizobium sp. DCY119]RJG43386.1 CPBP family intramembrane metalloprotease [Mesorhizobium sp. DCY119]
MTLDPTAFEQYRRSANKATLLRLFFGVLIILACWFGLTFGVIIGAERFSTQAGLPYADFLTTLPGILASLLSFAGIWLGVWIAVRLLHRERLGALFGYSRRISWPGFWKGLAAVLATSLLSEVLLYALQPDVTRSSLDLSSWLLLLIPAGLLIFLQTSSEEILFRGYLLRGLAHRFRSPLVWALLPGLAFVSLHWSPGTSMMVNAAGLASIGLFTVVLTLLVYKTGNLGAAMGAHLGNNLVAFLLVSHQSAFSSLALFNGKPFEADGWTSADMVLVTGIGLVASLLTTLLLLHPRSPLKVSADSAPLSPVPETAEASPVQP